MVFELRSKLLKYYSCPQTKCLYYVSWQLLILMCNFQIPDLIKSRNIWNIDDFLGPSCSGHLSRLLNSENFYNPDFFARPTYVWILEVTLYYCTYLTFLKTFLIKVPYKVWLLCLRENSLFLTIENRLYWFLCTTLKLSHFFLYLIINKVHVYNWENQDINSVNIVFLKTNCYIL